MEGLRLRAKALLLGALPPRPPAIKRYLLDFLNTGPTALFLLSVTKRPRALRA